MRWVQHFPFDPSHWKKKSKWFLGGPLMRWVQHSPFDPSHSMLPALPFRPFSLEEKIKVISRRSIDAMSSALPFRPLSFNVACWSVNRWQTRTGLLQHWIQGVHGETGFRQVTRCAIIFTLILNSIDRKRWLLSINFLQHHILNGSLACRGRMNHVSWHACAKISCT